MTLVEQVERIAREPLAEFKHWAVLVYLRYAPRVAPEDFQGRGKTELIEKHMMECRPEMPLPFPFERLN